MLTKRIIPCLDVNHGRVVKGRQFKNLRDVDDPVALGKAYSDAGADELVFYDITATHENRPVFTETVKAIAREISIPFTVGGGMRTTEDFREMLLAGADKVSVEGGRKNTGIDVLEWAKKGEALGAGEICMNSMDADGEKNGYDLELLKALSEILTIPVIASGGAGTMEDFKKAFEAGADAALAASVFHFGEIPIPDLKKYLAKEGIPIRPAE